MANTPYLLRPSIPAAQMPAQPVFSMPGQQPMQPAMRGPKPSLLTQPAPVYERKVPQQLDPTNMLWAGTLMDIGAFIANPFGYQMQGLGPQMMTQAMQYNNELETQRQNDILVNEQLTAARNVNAQVQNPYAQMPADIQEYELSGGDRVWGSYENFLKTANPAGQISNRPAGSQVTTDGELIIIDANGQVQHTGEYVKGFGTQVQDVGGAIFETRTGPGGQSSYNLVDPQGMQPVQDQISERATADAATQTDIAFDEFLSTDAPQLYSAWQNTVGLIDEMKAGGYNNTGPIAGRVSKYFDPETALLQAKNVMRTLENLQITNLAPVTEKELALVRGLYADITNGREINIAILEDAAQMLKRKLDFVNKKTEYKRERGTLRGFSNDMPIFDMSRGTGAAPAAAGATDAPKTPGVVSVEEF